MYGPYAHGWMWGGGGSGMLFGGLGMILIWGILLALLFLLARYLMGTQGDSGKNTPAARDVLEILKETYARGEIGREEYLRKRDDLLEQ